MYERDITYYERYNSLSDCPNCGHILRLEPMAYKNKFLPRMLQIKSYGYKNSYRLLRCKNGHMIIVISEYINTFDADEYKRIRRFELCCDDDNYRKQAYFDMERWDAKYLKGRNQQNISGIIKNCAGLRRFGIKLGDKL